MCLCVCVYVRSRTHDPLPGSVLGFGHANPQEAHLPHSVPLCCVFDIRRARASLQSSPTTPSVGIGILIYVLSPARHFSQVGAKQAVNYLHT